MVKSQALLSEAPKPFSMMVQQITKPVMAKPVITEHTQVIRDGKLSSVGGKKVQADKAKATDTSLQKSKTNSTVLKAKVITKSQGFNSTGVHTCPKCATSEDQTWSNEGVSLFCHHCNTTYSATTGKPIRAGHTRPNASKGYKIDKDRPEQNGVKRPSAGTVCGDVWAAFDANPTIKSGELAALALEKGWNKNNVSCEFYQWRKFHGIKGRTA